MIKNLTKEQIKARKKKQNHEYYLLHKEEINRNAKLRNEKRKRALKKKCK